MLLPSCVERRKSFECLFDEFFKLAVVNLYSRIYRNC